LQRRHVLHWRERGERRIAAEQGGKCFVRFQAGDRLSQLSNKTNQGYVFFRQD
jgi:hypothetical protein